MNELTLFQNPEFGTIRSLTIDGEPWFVGKDVAEALGYSNGRDALYKHVDDEDKQIIQRSQNATLENHIPKDVFPVDFVDANIPNRGLTIINESGVYSLIFGSKLESARRFKHWVTSEVLPAIRKTGSYSMNEKYDRMELARIISSCKSATAVKTISTLFEIGIKPIASHTPIMGNDSVSVFLERYDSKLLQTIPNQEVYADYERFCHRNDFTAITQGNFSRRVHKLTGLTVRRRRVNGELKGFFTIE